MAEAKKYQKPESFDALDIETIAELRALAIAERDELNATEGDLTAEQIDQLEAYMNDLDAMDERERIITEQAEALAQRQQAVRDRIAAKDAPADGASDDEGEGDGEQPSEPAAPAEPAPAEVVEVVEQPEAVAASAGQRVPTVGSAARRAPAVIINDKKGDEPVGATTTITAAGNVPAFDSGAQLDGLDQLAEAFLSRTEGFGHNDPNMTPGRRDLSATHTKHAVAKIQRKGNRHSVDKGMSVQEQFAAIMAAGDESNIAEGKNSVIAAGGWCAPSETIYDLFSYHTSEGTLDMPEVTASRGGISFTKGPDFMAIFGDPDAGFIQTETQAEAGTVKPCFALDCPPFEEVRLDAIGFCATAPLLTNAAYPELVRQVLDMLGAAHARRKSQYSINAILANIGTAGTRTFVPVGAAGHNSGIADVLGGLELEAMAIRQSLAMSTTATIEGFAPYWARAAFRHELSRRLSLTDPFRITDADVDGWLALRNIRLQYVYDYQMLTEATTGAAGARAWPTDLEITLYPAGAYTRLTNDVISLSAVYDHDLLTQNEYTAAFMEEGIAIANTRGYGRRVKFKLNYLGASGFPAIGSGSGVTFAAA